MKSRTKLEYFRRQSNISQSVIAKLLCCTISAYSKYENGDREPSIKVLIKLADFYKISIDELLNHEVKQSNDLKTIDVEKENVDNKDDIEEQILSLAKCKNNVDVGKINDIDNSLVRKIIIDYLNVRDCCSVNDIYRLIDYLLTISNENVTDLISVLKVSKSGYYHWKKYGDVVRKRNEPIAELIKQYEFVALESAGYAAVTAYLKTLPNRTDLHNISIARVKRIMDEFEIIPEDLRAEKNKLISSFVGQYNASNLNVAQNLLNRNFDINVPPCTYWCIDITEIRTDEGKQYLCAIIDICGRYLVGYSVSTKMDKLLIKRAIRNANRNAEFYHKSSDTACMIHSDRGVQFRSKDIIELIVDQNMIQSMSRPYNSNDNACIESFFSSLKCEYLYRFKLNTFGISERLIERYINFYNNIRIHQTIMDVPLKFWLGF